MKESKRVHLPKDLSHLLPIGKIRFPIAKDFVRSHESEEYLMSLYRKLIVKERKGMHISDLDFPRKALFDRLYPAEPTNEDMLKWIRGNSMHDFFEKIFKDNPKVKVEEPICFIRGGQILHATPDVLLRFVREELPHITIPIIMEFKSTLFELKDSPLPYEHWCRRLLNYMALCGTQMGILVVQIMKPDELRCYVSPQISMKAVEYRREMIFYIVKAFKGMYREKTNYFQLCPPWLCATPCRHIPRCYRSMKEYAERVQSG